MEIKKTNLKTMCYIGVFIHTTYSPTQICQPLTVALCVLARAQALNIGQGLLQKKYMVIVHGCGQQDDNFGEGKDSGDTLYRLLEDDPHSALNTGQTAACSPMKGRSGLDQARGLHASHSKFKPTAVLPCFLTSVLAWCTWAFWVCFGLCQ